MRRRVTEFHVTQLNGVAEKPVGHVRIPGAIFFPISAILIYELTFTYGI